MPYELKATLSLEDKLTNKMNAATRSVERFKNAVREASRSVGALAVAQQSLQKNYSGMTQAVASQNKAFANSMKGTSTAVKGVQNDMNGLYKTMEEYQKAGAKTQKTMEQLDVANQKHANNMREIQEKAVNDLNAMDERHTKDMKMEAEKRKTISENLLGQTILAEQNGRNEVNRIIEQGNQDRLNAMRDNENKMAQEAQRTQNRLNEIERQGAEVRRTVQDRAALTQSNAAARKAQREIEKAHNQAIAEEIRRTNEAATAQERLNKARMDSVKGAVSSGARTVGNGASNAARTMGFGLGMAGFGALYGAGYLGVQGLNSTMQFEQGIANIRAYANPEDRKNYNMYDKKGKMSDFSNYVMSLSGELPFGSNEVLDAAFQQSKAGVSYQDLVGKDGKGQLRTSLQLAAATDWVPEEAAAMLSQTKGAFRSEFANLQKKDKNFNVDEYVGNVITAGANFSTLDPEDYKKMIAMGAGVTKETGMSFEDYIMFGTSMNKAAGFVGGSDIGTSLKTWSNMVTNPTSGAKGGQAAMEAVGWYKGGKNQFYDDKGVLKPLEQLADLVYSATKGMTNEERVKTFNEVGGADAGRAFGGLFELGKDKGILKALKEEMGIADMGEMATERMKTAGMKMQLLTQTWENMMITFFGETLAPLAGIFQDITKYMQTDKFKASVAKAGKELSNGLSNWWNGLDELTIPGLDEKGKKINIKWDDMSTADKIIMGIDSALNRMGDYLSNSEAGKKLSSTISTAVGKMIEFIVTEAASALANFSTDQFTAMWENIQKGDTKQAVTNGLLGFGSANILTLGLLGTVAGGAALWGGKKIAGGIGKGAKWAWGKTPWGKKPPGTPPPGGTPAPTPSATPASPSNSTTRRERFNQRYQAPATSNRGFFGNAVDKTKGFFDDVITKTKSAGSKIASGAKEAGTKFINSNVGKTAGKLTKFASSWLTPVMIGTDMAVNDNSIGAAASNFAGGTVEFFGDIGDIVSGGLEKIGLLQEGTVAKAEAGREAFLNSWQEDNADYYNNKSKSILSKKWKDIGNWFTQQLENSFGSETVQAAETAPADTGAQVGAKVSEINNRITSQVTTHLNTTAETVLAGLIGSIGGIGGVAAGVVAGAGVAVAGGQTGGAIVSRDGRIASAADSAVASALNSAPIPVFSFAGMIGAFASRVAGAAKAAVAAATGGDGGGSSKTGKGSKAGGLNRVGSDGLYYLHKDEQVLTRGQANANRNGGGGGGAQIIITGNSFGSIRSQDDIDEIAKALARQINEAGGNM